MGMLAQDFPARKFSNCTMTTMKNADLPVFFRAYRPFKIIGLALILRAMTLTRVVVLPIHLLRVTIVVPCAFISLRRVEFMIILVEVGWSIIANSFVSGLERGSRGRFRGSSRGRSRCSRSWCIQARVFTIVA